MLRGDPTWQTSSTGPMSIPSSSEAVATSALSSPAWNGFPPSRVVVSKGSRGALTPGQVQALSELVCQTLRQSARVDENKSRPVVLHERRDAVEDLAHLLGGCDRPELAAGKLH